MKRAVESFEGNRGHFGGGARTRGGVAAGLLLAALSLTACDRSKVVIELDWDTGAIVEESTAISVVFKDPSKTDAGGTSQDTTDGRKLPSKPPLTLVYWVDDPSKKIEVQVVLSDMDGELLCASKITWDGKPISLCVGKKGEDCLLGKCPATDGGVADAGPDADGGPGGAAAGGHPGTGGAASGGAGGAGGSMNMTSSGGVGVGGKGEGGKGGAPTSSSGGSTGQGGKGGISIGPLGGSIGHGGVIGTGGIISIGGNPGSGGMATGGASTGGTASGGTNGNGTGGIVGTGGAVSTGGVTGSGGAPAPSCLTDTSQPCSCGDYCDALATSCRIYEGTSSRPNYYLSGPSPTREDCLNSCVGFGWTQGFIDPLAFGNTIGCRVTQAQELRCTAASPTGGNKCGVDRCAPYCAALDKNCPGTLHPFMGVADPYSACIRACTTSWHWDTSETLATMSAAGSVSTGNCRLYWAGQAGTTTDKKSACENAGPLSAVCQ